MALRFDRSKLGALKRLPAGGASVPARVSRTGVQTYRDEATGALVREYRPPSEVLDAGSLASFVGAPATIGHPKEGFVTPENWGRLAQGAMYARPAAENVDGEEYVTGDLALTTKQALDGVENGDLTEISVGYTCDTVDEPGVTPRGEKYDRIQTNIRANHIALLPAGNARAGRHARLKLDGNESQRSEFMKIRYDGVEYDTSSEADMQVLQRRIADDETKRTDEVSRIASLEKENGELQGKLDTANKRADEAEKNVPERVSGELKFREDMTKIGLPKDYSFDTKTRVQVKLDAIRHRNDKSPILGEKDPSEARIDGYLAHMLEVATESYEPKKPVEKTDDDDWRKRHDEKLKGFDGTSNTRAEQLGVK